VPASQTAWPSFVSHASTRATAARHDFDWDATWLTKAHKVSGTAKMSSGPAPKERCCCRAVC
jgi:hypothetical protein